MIALLHKEWREHRIALALLYLAGLVMLAIEWQQARNAITPLQAWHGMVTRFGVLGAIFLSQRLVVREYGAGTQLFLETLPVGRVTVILTKWLAGWGALLLFMLAVFGLILWGSREHVDIDPRFAALMAARAGAFLLLVYAAGFAIALTLRLRFYIWGLLLFGAFMLDQTIQLPMGDWPPFFLVKHTMVLHRGQAPWLQLGVTLGLALAALLCALAIAALARGALVVALARRLSARTRTILVVLCGGLVWLSWLLEERTDPPPFELQQAVASTARPEVLIGWSQPVGGVAAPQLAARISADLSAMQGWLDLAPLAATLLVPDAWGQPDQSSLATGGPGQVVVRAALGHPDLPLRDLQVTLRMVHLLDQAPLYRWREDRYWLLLGFANWWSARHDPQHAALLERRARAAAFWLQHLGRSPETALRSHAGSQELLGECLAGAYAWRAVQLLADGMPPPRFQALMRAALAKPLSDDLPALAKARASEALLEEAGMPLAQLAAVLARTLAPAGPARPPELHLQAGSLAGGLAELRYRLVNRPQGAVALRYRQLAPAEMVFHNSALAWLVPAERGVLPTTFAGGRQVLVFGEAHDPDLGCSYRFGAARKELP